MVEPQRDDVEDWKQFGWGRLPTWAKWGIGIVGVIALLGIGSALGSSEVDDLKAERDHAKFARADAEEELEEVEEDAAAILDRKADIVRDAKDRASQIVGKARAESAAIKADAAASEAGLEEDAAVEEDAEPSEPPNVVGLPLPEAKRLPREAGFRTAANNTDTALGIIVESNYTICTQSPPRGDLVVVLAQKYGC